MLSVSFVSKSWQNCDFFFYFYIYTQWRKNSLVVHRKIIIHKQASFVHFIYAEESWNVYVRSNTDCHRPAVGIGLYNWGLTCKTHFQSYSINKHMRLQLHANSDVYDNENLFYNTAHKRNSKLLSVNESIWTQSRDVVSVLWLNVLWTSLTHSNADEWLTTWLTAWLIIAVKRRHCGHGQTVNRLPRQNTLTTFPLCGRKPRNIDNLGQQS